MIQRYQSQPYTCFLWRPEHLNGWAPGLENLITSTQLSNTYNLIHWNPSPRALSQQRVATLVSDEGLKSKFMKLIWKIQCPSKFKIFSWLVMQDKILSKANLARRDWTGNTSCVFCGYHIDMVSCLHLFVYCPFVASTWNFFIDS